MATYRGFWLLIRLAWLVISLPGYLLGRGLVWLFDPYGHPARLGLVLVGCLTLSYLLLALRALA